MPKKFNVKITLSAQNDIEEIWQYIAVDSVKNAIKFIDELEKLIFSLELFPKRNPFIPENQILHTEYRHLIHQNYRIIYRISKSTVYILRIIHGYRLLTSDMIW